MVEKGRENLGGYSMVVLRKIRGKGSKPSRIGYHRGKKEKGKMGSLLYVRPCQREGIMRK